jgi:hypothetical protein
MSLTPRELGEPHRQLSGWVWRYHRDTLWKDGAGDVEEIGLQMLRRQSALPCTPGVIVIPYLQMVCRCLVGERRRR